MVNFAAIVDPEFYRIPRLIGQSGEPPWSLESWRYHVDIAALSETRIANEGQLREDGGGYRHTASFGVVARVKRDEKQV